MHVPRGRTDRDAHVRAIVVARALDGGSTAEDCLVRRNERRRVVEHDGC